MLLHNQLQALEQLKHLSELRKHNILISGISGCGKTYLAKQYANMLGIADFYMLSPSVSNLRAIIDTTIKQTTDIVVCIENLDSAVLSASYTILKFLEEPYPHVYIVITCKDTYSIPDTILSRSVQVSVAPCTHADIVQYMQAVNGTAYDSVQNAAVISKLHNYIEANTLLSLTKPNIEYLNSLCRGLNTKLPVASLVWDIGHFADGSPIPIRFSLYCIQIAYSTNTFVQKLCIQCLNELDASTIAQHAMLSNMILQLKYCRR